MTRKIAGYGWRPQAPDHRDLIFGLEEQVLTAAQLPGKFSLRSEFPFAVFNQDQIGSCVPNHAIENIMFRSHVLNDDYPMLSRLFTYYEGRKAEGDPLDQDTGMEVRTAFQVLHSEGAPPEVDWPYSDANPGPFSQQPPVSAYTAALSFEALVYKAIIVGAPGAPMRSAVSQRMPISFGFPVPDYFETYDAKNDYLRLPEPATRYIGGHCEDVIGWDFTCTRRAPDGTRFPPVFEIRNSWGETWGDDGHHWMDFRWFSPAAQLASDLWVIPTVKLAK